MTTVIQNDIYHKIKGTDNALLWGVFTATLAIWIFLYDHIVGVTTNTPAHTKLAPLAYIHYIILVENFCAVIILYVKGAIDSGFSTFFRKNKRVICIITICYDLIFILWVPFLLFSILAYFFAPIIQDVFHQSEEQMLVVALIIGILISYIPMSLMYKKKFFNNKWYNFFAPVFLIFPFMFIYLPMLALFSSNAKITTDKEFYYCKDSIIVSIKESGYVLNPRIKSVNYQGDTLFKDYCPSTFVIKHKETSDKSFYYSPYIEVILESQVFDIEKKVYCFLNVYDSVVLVKN